MYIDSLIHTNQGAKGDKNKAKVKITESVRDGQNLVIEKLRH